MVTYPTKRIETHVLYCVPLRLRSWLNEFNFPLIMAFLSRKLKKYMTQRIGLRQCQNYPSVYEFHML